MGQVKTERRNKIDAMRSAMKGLGIAGMVLAGCILFFGSLALQNADGTVVVFFIASCLTLAIFGLVLWAGGEALWILWEIREQLVPAPPATPEQLGLSPAPPPAAEPHIPAAHSPPPHCPSCRFKLTLPKGATVRPGQIGTCPVCKTKITV